MIPVESVFMENKNFVYIFLAVAAILVVAGASFVSFQGNVKTPVANQESQIVASETPSAEGANVGMVEYNPVIVPSDFVGVIDNRYLTLVPGTRFVYESETERIEVYVTNETKEILGVKTTVVWDRVWSNGSLIEDTRDWYAQDREGNVWYFGEYSEELALGKVVSTEGSWEAGVDGAEPGIVMEADPRVGDSYRQEYYAGKAEDMGEVLALGESVTVQYGAFKGCIKTRDWTPLEPDAGEYKYYCPSVGFTVLEVGIEDGTREGLTEFERNSRSSPSAVAAEEPKQGAKTGITEVEARQIALAEVPGKVTDVAKETKFGKLVFVVEVDAYDGPETDVIIDVVTGEVLGVET